MAARGQLQPSRGLPDSKSLSFASPKESNQRKATPIFALILRCSQRAGPAQIARWRANRARWAHGAGLGPRVAPLLGVEYRGTPLGRILDRFAMRFTGSRCKCQPESDCAVDLILNERARIKAVPPNSRTLKSTRFEMLKNFAGVGSSDLSYRTFQVFLCLRMTDSSSFISVVADSPAVLLGQLS